MTSHKSLTNKHLRGKEFDYLTFLYLFKGILNWLVQLLCMVINTLPYSQLAKPLIHPLTEDTTVKSVK